MTSKLTISVDKDIIVQAKQYAQQHGKSLSGLIENYLKLLVEKEDNQPFISPEIRKLQGSITLPDDFDYKKDIASSPKQKFNQ